MKSILLAVAFVCVSQAQTGGARTWDRKAAAAYLDARMNWWESWAPAVRDHDTFCVSCHTSLTYAMSRPTLRPALGETNPTAEETKFVANISKRVSLWQDLKPYYDDKAGAGKADESRGTEVVLNALVLARYQAPATADALRQMFAMQIKTGDQRGSWTWMNFHFQPWEAEDSAFWGAAMAALAAGWAPKSLRDAPESRDGLALLAGYLQREQANQSTINRANVLWASGKLPSLLTQLDRMAIFDAIAAKQRPDGGWNTSAIAMKDWKRKDGTPLDAASDGYATALMLTALQESGVPSAKEIIARGRQWLEQNQDSSGAWVATSMNKQRDPQSDPGRFMNDAATAYAVMALSR